MPYIKKTYRYKDVVEVERVHSGRFGCHGRNGKRVKRSSKEMQKINERNCIKKLRRKIQANFDANEDLFVTLTYNPERIPDAAGAKKCIHDFLGQLRHIWKKAGIPLKYIIVTEYKNVRIHHHIVLNDLPNGTGPKTVSRLWKKYGRSGSKYLYEDGRYEMLAAYLVKETNKSFRDPGNPSKLRYSCSRNLTDPKPEIEIMRRDDWPEDPRVSKGFCLDKASLYNGIDKRGYKCQYYRLIRLEKRAGTHKGKPRTRHKMQKGKKNGSRTWNGTYRSKRNEGDQTKKPPAAGGAFNGYVGRT